MLVRFGCRISLFGLLLLFVLRAQAEEARPPVQRTFVEELSVSAGVESLADTPLEESGEVGVRRTAISGGATVSAGSGARLGFGLEIEKSAYDFSGVEEGSLPAEFEDVSTTELKANYFKVLSDDWFLFGLGLLSCGVEEGADAAEGRTFGALGGLRRQVNERFGFSVGLLVRTRLEDDPLVLPFPGVDWMITDRLALRTAEGITLSYQFDEMMRWKGEVTAGFKGREFRLDDEGGLPDGLVEDRSVPCTVGLVYSPRRDIHVRLAVGSVVWQEYEFKDSEGRHVATENPDMPARYVSLDAGVKF